MSEVRLYVIPTRGQFTNPDTQRLLPVEGAWVRPSTFWHRRLLDGSVKQGQPPVQAPAADAVAAPAGTAEAQIAEKLTELGEAVTEAIDAAADGGKSKKSKGA